MDRRPLVRPVPWSQGGGVAPAFGGSGAPAVPVPGSRRAKMLALQYADDERGRFTERVFVFPQYSALVPGGVSTVGAQQLQTIQVTSNRTSFVRLVACRGVLQRSTVTPLTGLELAQLTLRLQINGEEDLTTSGQVSGAASFATLFAQQAAPWFFFAAPPRLRVGDQVDAIVTNITATGGATLTPEVSLRLVDDEWWRLLYGGELDDDSGV